MRALRRHKGAVVFRSDHKLLQRSAAAGGERAAPNDPQQRVSAYRQQEGGGQTGGRAANQRDTEMVDDISAATCVERRAS